MVKIKAHDRLARIIHSKYYGRVGLVGKLVPCPLDEDHHDLEHEGRVIHLTPETKVELLDA